MSFVSCTALPAQWSGTEEEEESVHTPLCTNAIGFSPIGHAPVEDGTCMLEGYAMALEAPPLSPQGTLGGGPIDPPRFGLEELFDLGAWML